MSFGKFPRFFPRSLFFLNLFNVSPTILSGAKNSPHIWFLFIFILTFRLFLVLSQFIIKLFNFFNRCVFHFFTAIFFLFTGEIRTYWSCRLKLELSFLTLQIDVLYGIYDMHEMMREDATSLWLAIMRGDFFSYFYWFFIQSEIYPQFCLLHCFHNATLLIYLLTFLMSFYVHFMCLHNRALVYILYFLW